MDNYIQSNGSKQESISPFPYDKDKLYAEQHRLDVGFISTVHISTENKITDLVGRWATSSKQLDSVSTRISFLVEDQLLGLLVPYPDNHDFQTKCTIHNYYFSAYSDYYARLSPLTQALFRIYASKVGDEIKRLKFLKRMDPSLSVPHCEWIHRANISDIRDWLIEMGWHTGAGTKTMGICDD